MPSPSRHRALPFLAVLLALICPPRAGRAQTILTPGATNRASEHQADIVSARAAALLWLGRVDAGEFGRSWQEAAPYFQRISTEARWTDLLGNVRLPLGRPVYREATTGEFSVVMPGMPDGAYVFLQFQTEFERKKTTVETMTLLRDTDGRWKVAGYFIK